MVHYQLPVIPFLCALGALPSFINNESVSAFIQSPWTKKSLAFTNKNPNINSKNSFLMNSPLDSSDMDSGEAYNSQLDTSPLQPLEENEVRQNRILREQALQKKYVQDNDLMLCRSRVRQYKLEYLAAKLNQEYNMMNKLEGQIRYERSRDAEFVYAQALKAFREATMEGRDEAAKFHQVAMDAKSCLPQFNLEGLWVGKYGSHGYEMINVTYVDNTLLAYKVTGDKRVPKGEITFSADLTPNLGTPLEPIDLSGAATNLKNLVQFPFPGEGQVASEGYGKTEWMEGQLLTIGKYFSFAWVPIGHQVFFGRASPEVTLKLLKDSQISLAQGEDIGVAKMREQATRSLGETMILEEDEEVNSQYTYSSLGGIDASEIGDDCFQ